MRWFTRNTSPTRTAAVSDIQMIQHGFAWTRLRSTIGGRVPLFFILVIGLIASIDATEAEAQNVAYEREQRVRIPAPEGISSEQLGRGRPINGSGFSVVEVVPDASARTVSESDNSYEADLRLQQSQFQLNATANALGLLSGEWSDASKNRYALLKVQNITRVDRLDLQGGRPRNVDADYFISAIYYGWSLDVMIRGRSSSFTSGVAANLQSVIGQPGGDFRRMAQSNQLTTKVRLRGLEPKGSSVPIALSAEEVRQNFRIAEAEPIMVEYTFLKDVESEPIEWETRQIGPGRYQIDEIGVKVSNQTRNGKSWDFSGPPDPMITFYQDGALKANLGRQRDTQTATFQPQRPVNLNAGTSLQFAVEDKDLSEPDFIGEMSITFDELSRQKPGTKIPLSVEGSVLQGWVVLSELDRSELKDIAAVQGSTPESYSMTTYRGSNGVMRMSKPEGWRDHYQAGWGQDGYFNVGLMLAPESAEVANVDGYLSEGVRVNLWVAPRGQQTNVEVERWAPQAIRGLLQSNPGFERVDSSRTQIANGRTITYTLAGESEQISEPERNQLVFIATPRYLARIDLVSPARLWDEYQPLFQEVSNSLHVIGAPER